MAAVGIEVGGEENYVGTYAGYEEMSDGTKGFILMEELGVGVEVPDVAGVGETWGVFITHDSWGVYLGQRASALGQHARGGIGISLPNSWRDRLWSAWGVFNCSTGK